MYEQGTFGKVDIKKALYWYEKAADNGIKDASLAIMLLEELTSKSRKDVSINNSVNVSSYGDEITSKISTKSSIQTLKKVLIEEIWMLNFV